MTTFGNATGATTSAVSFIRYYALDRDVDASGVSGTGRVAYVVEFGSGALLVWDKPNITADWRESLDVLEQIHGHNGATRITPLDDDPGGRARALELLGKVIWPVLDTYTEALRLVTTSRSVGAGIAGPR